MDVSPIRTYKISERGSSTKLYRDGKSADRKRMTAAGEMSTPLFSKTSGGLTASAIKTKGVSSSNGKSRNLQIRNLVEQNFFEIAQI